MYELLIADQNDVFTIALVLMLVIAVMEGAAAFVGAGLSGFLDSILPDLDVDMDLGADVSPSVLSRLFGWLRIGQVPAMMLFVVFLTAFGLIGLSLQSITNGLIGFYLPTWIAAIAAFFVAMPIVRVIGGLLTMVMPRDETDAVAESTFIGRIATITLGTAALGSPAEAKLRDEHGFTHYVMVEPDTTSVTFEQGSAVLLTERNGAFFRAIRSTSEALKNRAN